MIIGTSGKDELVERSADRQERERRNLDAQWDATGLPRFLQWRLQQLVDRSDPDSRAMVRSALSSTSLSADARKKIENLLYT
jgi:hypothetical protein